MRNTHGSHSAHTLKEVRVSDPMIDCLIDHLQDLNTFWLATDAATGWAATVRIVQHLAHFWQRLSARPLLACIGPLKLSGLFT